MIAPRLDPVIFGPNYAKHSPLYVGGGGIGRFRGLDADGPVFPEDWVASTTTRFGEDETGLTRLEDGTLLRDAIEKDPEAYLGPEHVARFGSNAGLLVKLLDSANRLGVHLHPSDDFARRHLDCDYGKTEAWVVLDTAGDEGEVWVAFTRDVEQAELGEWRSTQAVDELLGALHHVAVRPGSAVLVPAGVPHAIGAHVLCLELQEPTDFSIGLERRWGPDAQEAGAAVNGGDLGLGVDLALQAVDRQAWSEERVRRLIGPGMGAPGAVLPDAANPFFRTELLSAADGPVGVPPGFTVLIGVRGSGSLTGGASGDTIPLQRGSTVLVPFAAGPVTLAGEVEAVACRPGDPSISRPSRPEV